MAQEKLNIEIGAQKPDRNRDDILNDIILRENVIEKKRSEINELQRQIIELRKENFLFCDEDQWFTEEEEEHIISRRPKKSQKFLVGKIHWKEDFKDESTDEYITINRSQVVRVDGKWK